MPNLAICVVLLADFVAALPAEDPCVPHRRCPFIYHPVCASNGVTYSSLCHLQVETCGTTVTFSHTGECIKTTGIFACPLKPCPPTSRPVCGSDGRTYSNICVMESQTCGKVTVAHQGECGNPPVTGPCPPKPCPYIYRPVCGRDGVTYPSRCDMESQTCGTVTVAYYGECGKKRFTAPCPPKPCPYIYHPICGSDGLTYRSRCAMESQTCGRVIEAHSGECVNTSVAHPCRPSKFCRPNYDPACGSDGVTYANLCLFESLTCGRNVTVEHKLKCVKTTSDFPCPPKPCPNIYFPVCGSDGVTYRSRCAMESQTCGKVTVSYQGECNNTNVADPCQTLEECPSVNRPVCGSDRVTYTNLCKLNSETCGKNVTVAHEGECVPSTTDAPCPSQPCNKVDDPVCGSDGVTYTNPCIMELQTCGRVVVDYFGECLDNDDDDDSDDDDSDDDDDDEDDDDD